MLCLEGARSRPACSTCGVFRGVFEARQTKYDGATSTWVRTRSSGAEHRVGWHGVPRAVGRCARAGPAGLRADQARRADKHGASGAPTIANDALRYVSRMFRRTVRNHRIERNPAAAFDPMDAGGDEVSRDRWLTLDERQQLATAALLAQVELGAKGPPAWPGPFRPWRRQPSIATP